MLAKKLEMIHYLNKRDKRIKFKSSDDKFTSFPALIKAKQLLWKVHSDRMPLLQNATYRYTFVWVAGQAYNEKKYYVIDIYDDNTYARILKNPSEIYVSPQFKDKVSYSKLYNNINRIIKDFFKVAE